VDGLPCPYCRGSGRDPETRAGVCLRCEGTGEREPILLLRAFEVGYRRGIGQAYEWLGVEPPDGIATRAIALDELRRRVQSLEDESVRHYD
jgi:hypothetical protein